MTTVDTMDVARLRGLSNQLLHLIVLPTEACNFRCVYCYEDFRYERMEPWVAAGLKRWISNRAPGLQQLSLSWFGGEPLLARDIIESTMEHARRESERNPGMLLDSDMTTNGFLLKPAVLRRLVDLGVRRYQISFDGPRELHDRVRVRRGRQGTFDAIWTNLLDSRSEPGAFRITVRLHVSDENRDAVPRFLDEYEAAFGADPRFEIFIRPLSRLGGPNDGALQVMEREAGRRVVDALRADAARRGLRQLLGGDKGEICYAARGNSFVVRADGRLNKCTVALEHPTNQVGRLAEDGSVAIDAATALPWMRGLRSGDAEELRCPMTGLARPAGAPAGSIAPIPLAVAR